MTIARPSPLEDRPSPGTAPPRPAAEAAPPVRLRAAFYATGLAVMLGWLLWLGQAILLPVIAAVIALYVLSAAAEGLGRVPVLGRTPLWLRRALALVGFTALVAALFALVATTFAQVVAALPGYQSNIDALVVRGAGLLGLEDEPNWARLREATLGRIDAAGLVRPLVGSVGSFGATLFLVVLYAAFFFAERMQFAGKLALAMGGAERGAQAMALLRRVNERIGGYLLVKTVVNAILGAVSFAIMWVFGIEFAAFWAVLIAALNYVPYVGSLLGVVFPVLLSLAQFGSFGVAAATLAALTAAQVYVGSVLEPRMMGRAFNLSPFVVLLALAFWGAMWGVAGAILAVPLTASLVIVLAEIEATRPVAILLSANGRL